jgi:hypothetical protein
MKIPMKRTALAYCIATTHQKLLGSLARQTTRPTRPNVFPVHVETTAPENETIASIK